MTYRVTKGFALPTVLIASAIMLTVLLASATSLTSIRASLMSQYYTQIAQTASEAGIKYAKACIANNRGQVTWDTTTPLRPNTDCTGTPINGYNCTDDSTTPGCFVTINGNIRSTFSVDPPTSYGSYGYVTVHSEGTTKLIKTTSRTVWRTYTQNSFDSSVLAAYYNYFDGADGSVTISANKNINTDIIASSRTCVDAINYSVTNLTSSSATLSPTPAAGCLSYGDEILLINLQGTVENYVNAGNYEIVRVKSVSSNIVKFVYSKTKYYGNGASDDLNIGTGTGNQRVMIQRIPHYDNVTINSGVTVTANAWNGIMGGVFMFKAKGTLTNNGTINMNSKGYRSSVGGVGSRAGESRLGFSNSCYPSGGGGGASSNPIHFALGGGGGYATPGMHGFAVGYSNLDCAFPSGGKTYGTETLSALLFGSGGGAAGYGDGSGAGIIYILANSIVNNGAISSNGSTATIHNVYMDGSGAGGSILLISNGSTSVGSNSIQAIGGNSTSMCENAPCSGGGVGRIAISASSITGTTNPAYKKL